MDSQAQRAGGRRRSELLHSSLPRARKTSPGHEPRVEWNHQYRESKTRLLGTDVLFETVGFPVTRARVVVTEDVIPTFRMA